MSTNTEKIITQEIRSQLDKTKSIVENFRTAVDLVKDHWLAPPEKEAFDAAVLAVSATYGLESPEFERIKQEMVFVKALFYTPSNVPVDWKQLLDSQPKDFEPIGFVKIWKELYKK